MIIFGFVTAQESWVQRQNTFCGTCFGQPLSCAVLTEIQSADRWIALTQVYTERLFSKKKYWI